MTEAILTLNAGSSSVKASLHNAASDDATPLWSGRVESIGPSSRIASSAAPGLERAPSITDHAGAVRWSIETALAARPGTQIVAVGHRVVHGGTAHAAPALIDDATFAALEALSPLAPGHQPHNLTGAALARAAAPEAIQVACFDTAFHASMPNVERLFALPRAFASRGVLRYGFHGLSYAYIASVLPTYLGKGAAGRVIVAHLGAGASLCAMREQRSVATTMGFTALDGLPMGTRCGAVDPGLLLYLLREEKMSADALADMLYDRSGLLGVSQVSGDMRELLASDRPAAKEAVDLFAYRTAQAIGALAATLGGVDALVFTGGVGENAAPVRARICALSAWLGLELDTVANDDGGPRLTAASSPVTALVIPTDEEREIARGTRAVLARVRAG